MLKLASSKVVVSDPFSLGRGVYRLGSPTITPRALRSERVAICLPGEPPPPAGFLAYAAVDGAEPGPYNTFCLSSDFSYLRDGDIVCINGHQSKFRTLFRKASPCNSLLLTERCNHYCVMCSQPPKTADDTQLILDLIAAIPLMDRSTKELVLSGGEPTLAGELFFDLLHTIKKHLPYTAIHVLSNGRTAADPKLASRIAAVGLSDLMFGIPLYSADPETHNFVVQAANAFDETLRGIVNLKNSGVPVEIRVVMHRYTIPGLVDLANFVATNLTFVDHVAFMGLEATGFAKSNWNDLWIDPRQYQGELTTACKIAARNGSRVSVYNLPLCWVGREILPYYVKSISDWKNDYLDTCETCAAATSCGGFFSSNIDGKVSESMLVPYTLSSFARFKAGDIVPNQ